MVVKFDQHFLKNSEVIDLTIMAANISNSDVIYEIGPGQGVLTKKILKENPKKLISVEMDETLLVYLEEIRSEFGESFSFEIGKDGVLEIDSFEFTKLIANIPYSITEPLYKKMLAEKVDFAVLLHGRDFYKKLILKNNKWFYFVNAFYDVDLLKEVPGTDFEPRTKTVSVLVKLELKKGGGALSKFDLFLQELYAKRKRNSYNAFLFSLVDVLGLPKKEIKNRLLKLGFQEDLEINLSSNLENISNENFVILIEKIMDEFF